MADEECPHGLTAMSCSICKNGPTLRSPDPELRVDRCRSCEEPVIWVVTEKAKPMPLDATPDPVNGRFIIVEARRSAITRRSTSRSRTPELEDNFKPMYASHFQSCPDSAAWKRS